MTKNQPLGKSIVISWLYPDLMNTYGDRGNIICLKKRCEWRKINCEVRELEIGFNENQLEESDLVFMGGAQDQQQQIVAKDLFKKQKALKNIIEKGIPGLYICGAYQFLGNYYKEANGTLIKGLGILDLYTENPGLNIKRLIGNIAVNTNFGTLVGFENHGGRTYLGKNVKPLGTVISGFGNNGKDKTEGAIFKNSICSYLHGPILPKNPILADFLIQLTLEKKFNQKIKLLEIDDSLEKKARETIAKRLSLTI
jgi:lipid II isoglutaminyl synthase (glutamine-hydrolysing)